MGSLFSSTKNGPMSGHFDDCSGKICSFDSDCDLKNFCCPIKRRCVQIGIYDACEVNEQCPEHSQCHPALFRCYPVKSNNPEDIIEWDIVDGKTCRTDFHCHRDSYCKDGFCVPLPLLSESCHESGGKCKRPFICSKRDRTCRMPCWNNFDCQQNYKWWNEASLKTNEGKLLTAHKRLDCPGSAAYPLFPMAEGGQGYCCDTLQCSSQASVFDVAMGYDWCNTDGFYCDISPGFTSFKLISLALVPLALVIGMVIFFRMMSGQRKTRPSTPNSNENTEDKGRRTL